MEASFYSALHSIQLSLWMMSAGLLATASISLFIRAQMAVEPLVSHENRRAIREICDLFFDLEGKQGRFNTSSAQLLNLSSSGACMASLVALHTGERIQGQLRTTDEKRELMTGRVIWSQKQTHRILYGIQFEEL